MKKILFVIVAVLLVLGIGLLIEALVYTPAWDTRLAERIHPDESNLTYLKRGLDTRNVDAQYGDFSMHIGQTFGDGYTLYIPLDIQFSEDTWQAWKPDDASDDVSLIPAGVLLVDRAVSQQEIDGQSFDALSALFRGEKYSARVDMEPWATDAEQRQLSYLISFSTHNRPYNKEDVSLIVDKLMYTDAQGEQVFSPGPFVLSWTPKNKLPTFEHTFSDEHGNAAGALWLTPLQLRSNFYSSKGVFDTIDIVMKDGSCRSYPRKYSTNKTTIPFFPPLNPDEVASIRISCEGKVLYDIALS